MKLYKCSITGRRDYNEDTSVVITNMSNTQNNFIPINLFCVFDGHGGNYVSRYLKREIPRLMVPSNNIYNYENKSINIEKLSIFIDNISSNIDKNKKQSESVGSTACILIMYMNKNCIKKVISVNVGDSRAIKCNKSNSAVQLTIDHKPNFNEEKTRIKRNGGNIYYDGYVWRINGLSLSRSFGDLDSRPHVIPTPDIFTYNILNTDKFLLLATDGLWDVFSNEAVIDNVIDIYKNKKDADIAEELANRAYKKGSLDNITIIIYFL